MHKLYIFIAIITLGCNSRVQETQTSDNTDTVVVEKPAPSSPASEKIYTNERFKDVVVQKTGEHTFLVTGKGQIFEASFSWVIEDGHDELLQGHQMTDAGAPAWGNFSFTLDIQKEQENSTLTLILFESSPKDGSRQYELPIVLY
jgi:hypothetical protein